MRKYQALIGAFQQALALLGWTIGRNVRIDIRWATTNATDIRRQAAELVALTPDVVLAHGAGPVGALLQVSRTVPIVFPVLGDPVGAGYVERREFMTLVASGAAWPLVASAQQAMRVIGFLRSAPIADVPHLVKAFRDGLKEGGFVEGQNVTIEYRSGDDNRGRLIEQVRELIQRPVDVVVGNVVAAAAAKAATATIPIVFATGSDPVADGLITSLNRPCGNITGVSFLGGVVGTKRLELLRQLVPKATLIAMLVEPKLANTEAERRDVLAAARASGQQLVVADVSNLREVEDAFTTFVKRGAGALYVGTGAFMTSSRVRLAALAARYALPSSFSQREGVEGGGLMSYGTSQTDAYRQVGVFRRSAVATRPMRCTRWRRA